METEKKKKVRKPPSAKEMERARIRSRAWYAANKERARKQQAVYNAEHADEIKAARKAHYDANKATILAKQKQYIDDNRDSFVQRWRKYSQRNAPAIQARTAAYIAKYPERHREYCKTWAKNNPDAVRRKDCDRRARKRYAGGKLSPGLIPALLERQNCRCVYCPADITEHYHLDHRVPLKRGGEHADHNMQLLCPRCNQRKGALDPIEFAARLRRHKRFRAEWITRANFISGRLSYQKPSTQTRSSTVT